MAHETGDEQFDTRMKRVGKPFDNRFGEVLFAEFPHALELLGKKQKRSLAAASPCEACSQDPER